MPDPIAKNIVYKNRNTAEEVAHYKPAMYADEIGLTSDKYIALNSSVSELPLRISFEPMGLEVPQRLCNLFDLSVGLFIVFFFS